MSLKNVLSIPTYSVKLPSTNKEYKIRPFLVKEEKVLLIAKESKDIKQIYDAIKDVLQNCIVSPKNIDVDKMCYFDVEYLFLQLRCKSMGEKIEILVTDPETKQKFETDMDLEKIYVANLNKKPTKIKLNDNLAVELKYPAFSDFIQISNDLINSAEKSSNRVLFIINVLSMCVDKVHTKEQTIDCSTLDPEEVKEFIDSLQKEEFEKLAVFLNDFPKMQYKGKFKNPTTGKEFPVEVSDFTNFFI